MNRRVYALWSTRTALENLFANHNGVVLHVQSNNMREPRRETFTA